VKVSDWSLPIGKDITADFVVSEGILARAMNHEIQQGHANVHCSAVPGPFVTYPVKQPFYDRNAESLRQRRGSLDQGFGFRMMMAIMAMIATVEVMRVYV